MKESLLKELIFKPFEDNLKKGQIMNAHMESNEELVPSTSYYVLDFWLYSTEDFSVGEGLECHKFKLMIKIVEKGGDGTSQIEEMKEEITSVWKLAVKGDWNPTNVVAHRFTFKMPERDYRENLVCHSYMEGSLVRKF